MADLNPTRRIRGLDTLRALAIVLVVVAHYPKPDGGLVVRMLNFGWIGVDLFFVLSGYLIGGQLFTAMPAQKASAQEVSLRDFYLRRFLRTLPNYYVTLAAYGLLAVWVKTDAPTPIWRFAAFVQNFGVPPTFSPSWSLCVEEQFYLLFPMIVMAMARSRWSRFGAFVLGGILILEIGVRSGVWIAFRPDLLPEAQAARIYSGHLYFPTYCRLDGITLGVSIAALRRFRPDLWRRMTERPWLLLGGSGVFLGASVLALWNRYSYFCSAWGFTFISISFALLVILALCENGWLNRREIPGARFLALCSYSFYLTHSLALEFAARLISRLRLSMTSPLGMSLSAVTILLFALLLYHLVEKRSLSLRDRIFRGERRPSWTPSALMVSKAQSL